MPPRKIKVPVVETNDFIQEPKVNPFHLCRLVLRQSGDEAFEVPLLLGHTRSKRRAPLLFHEQTHEGWLR